MDAQVPGVHDKEGTQMTPEGRVKAKVKRALASVGYVFMPVQRGLGAAALDYYCCFTGRFVAIETKVEGKKLTLRQVFTAKEVAKTGGLVCVVRNEHDIRTVLELIRDRNHAAGIYDTLGSAETYGEHWCQ
jgi:hypothetical protein